MSRIPGKVTTAILRALLDGRAAVKAIAFDCGVSENYVRRLAARHQLTSMLVLPAERQQLLLQRRPAA